MNRLATVNPPVWAGECFRWQGAHNSGYGTLKGKRVHRVFWELFNGPIPEGITIDHVYSNGCRFRDCFRLSHLEAVPRAENSRRSRLIRELMARTHCPQDHEYTLENTRWTGPNKTQRRCRKCIAAAYANQAHSGWSEYQPPTR